jgi:hypothetical protein
MNQFESHFDSRIDHCNVFFDSSKAVPARVGWDERSESQHPTNHKNVGFRKLNPTYALSHYSDRRHVEHPFGLILPKPAVANKGNAGNRPEMGRTIIITSLSPHSEVSSAA